MIPAVTRMIHNKLNKHIILKNHKKLQLIIITTVTIIAPVTTVLATMLIVI